MPQDARQPGLPPPKLWAPSRSRRADVDVERVAATAVATKFRNSGQVCTSPTRFLIEASVYERFVRKFVETVRTLRVGDPLQATTQVGPVKNERRLQAVEPLLGLFVNTLVCRTDLSGARWKSRWRKLKLDPAAFGSTVSASTRFMPIVSAMTRFIRSLEPAVMTT